MIVTFYSYKGGVGRSMALANVADILARRGARVLMVDFDLEAPGLEQYFEIPQGSARGHAGLIDLLAAFKEALAVGGARQADFRNLDQFILPIYPTLPGGGSLHLMPAGKREGVADLERYATSVRSFDWQDFYFNWEGELFFEWLRDQLTSDRYDLVLVDSRTGVTEMGGICSYQLADQIVMLCASNRQNLRGTENVALDFTSDRVMARRGDRPLDIVVVPARVEQRDAALLEGFLHEFDEVFQRYAPLRLREEGLNARTLMIPYQPELAFEERVVTDPARGTERNRIAVAFLDLARAITLLAPETSRVAGLCHTDGASAEAAPQFDVASRFSGYDVHLAGSTTVREVLERLRQGLDDAGVEVFLDAMEPVPPEEWLRRSEQILFHSGLLLLVSAEVTTGQQQALRSLLRANRGAKNRPVRVVSLGGSADGGLARVLELDTEAVTLAGGPEDPRTIGELTALARAAAARRTGTTGERTVTPTRARPSAEVPVPTPPPPSAGPSVAASHPFQGEDPFREDQAGYFFGREQLVSDLVSAVEAHRRVWLLGPSSAGKTSAVLAGAFPALRSRSTARVLERVVVGRECVAAIATALGRMPRSGERHVLFVDDFEQAFELPAAERDALLTAVTRLETERPDVVVLLGAGEDGIARFRHPPLSLDPSAPSTIAVADFTTAELRAAIERPAERGGLAYEPGLVDRILSDAGRQATAVGLVQRTLSRLWDNRREGWLTNAAYERAGGIAAVVAEIADASLARCSDQSGLVDKILSRLIAVDAPTSASTPPPERPEGQAPRQQGIHLRRRLCVPLAELLPAEGDVQSYRAAIGELILGGLLVARANRDDEPCVELVHDAALARPSKLGERLAKLVAADQEFLLWRQRLGEGIARREGLTGGALRQAQAWLKGRPGDLSSKERGAIERAIMARYIRVAAAVVLFAGMIAYAFIQQRQAGVDRAIAAVTAADELRDQGRLADAVDSLNVAYNQYPFRDSLLLKRGQVYARRGDDSLALADFTAALAINPDLTGARVARAATFLENGDYTQAIAQYEEALRRDPGAAAAYAGRATARIQLKGDTDSSLADFSAAFQADSTLVAALFDRGRLNENLGNVKAAVQDFERFLSLTPDPTSRLAAQTRLDSLARSVPSGVPPPTRQPQVTRATVFLQYADPADARTIAQLGRVMRQSGTLNVPTPELMKKVVITGPELRYVQGDDRFAKQVRAAAEEALAKAGYLIRLEPRVLDRKRFPGARSGNLEIWLPPLSRTLYSVPAKAY